jgi:L-ascorbate metabolism protein UlaG (beta-lactamase superfamily)
VKRRIAAGAALAAAALAWHAGWTRGERPWRSATGWDRIPAAERVPSTGAALAVSGAPRLAWLGQAGFLLEWRGERIAVDPNLSPRCTIVRRELERTATPADLGALDAVLVTHAHFDHLDLPTLAALPRVDRLLLPRGSEGYASSLAAAPPIVGLAPWESARVGELEIVAVPAFHHGSRWHPLASARLAVGWIVRSGEEAIYFAGDTGERNDFAAIRERYRPRIAVLPIGGFAPAWPIGRVHLSPEQAVAVARELGAELVVPSHFGTFALALDRVETALPRFARAARAAGVAWAMPEMLDGGGAE